MPKGDPAGYLPTVKKARAAARAKGGNPYTPRASRSEVKFAPKKGVRRQGPVPTKGVERQSSGGSFKPPFSMGSRPKFASGSAPRKLAKAARYTPDQGATKKFPLNRLSPGFRRAMEGPTRRRSA